MARFMTEAAERGFREAIEAIEKVSAAEVVVAVRPRLRPWLVAHLAVATLFLAAVLAFVLFSEDYEFELWTILLGPILAGVAGGLAVEAIPPLERVLVPKRVRDAIVREAARAEFYELGVHGTKGRTGVLVFVALRERRVVLVGDLAVVKELGEPKLHRFASALARMIPSGGAAMASALAKLADDFAKALPRQADDTNELADLVKHVRRPKQRRFRGSAV